MKTLRLLLVLFFLVATSFSYLQANSEKSEKSHRRVAFRIKNAWVNHSERSSPLIPIDAYVVDNNCIEVRFFGDADLPSNFQIRDSHGSLIYETVAYPSDESYKIDLIGLAPGKYTLIYSDQHIEIGGDFEKE